MLNFKKPSKTEGIKFPLKYASVTVLAILLVSITFATIYYFIDHTYDDDRSRLRGVSDKNSFASYLYYSIIITSTLGLGEIVPHTGDDSVPVSWSMRTAVCMNVFAFIFVTNFLDSWENYVLVL